MSNFMNDGSLTEEAESEFRYKIIQAQHAQQTGIAFNLNHDPKLADPKHMRVGINAAMIEHGAIAKLLIEKGVFTKKEYLTTLLEMHEREVDYMEKILTERLGTEIHLH